MTVYADEKFYKNEYLCGRKAVIDTAFDFYARQATTKIKQYTFDNIDETNIPDGVKMCCCEVAELLYKTENTAHGGISSEKVGDQSVSYESTDIQTQNLRKNIKSSVYSWLAESGLLYRGVC